MTRVRRTLSELFAAATFCVASLVAAAPITVTTPPPAPAATPATPAVPAGPVLDINSASADQLATLPGIGPARSAAIVSGRPYARKDELVKRKIIPASVYTKIKTQIIAKQS